MSWKPPLGSGTTGFRNDQGEFVCTGSRMGRSDVVPDAGGPWPKLHLIRMDMSSCGAYDYDGAYWGSGDSRIGWMYLAIDKKNQVNIFIRATTRLQAMEKILKTYPQAKFIRRSYEP